MGNRITSQESKGLILNIIQRILGAKLEDTKLLVNEIEILLTDDFINELNANFGAKYIDTLKLIQNELDKPQAKTLLSQVHRDNENLLKIIQTIKTTYKSDTLSYKIDEVLKKLYKIEILMLMYRVKELEKILQGVDGQDLIQKFLAALLPRLGTTAEYYEKKILREYNPEQKGGANNNNFCGFEDGINNAHSLRGTMKYVLKRWSKK